MSALPNQDRSVVPPEKRNDPAWAWAPYQPDAGRPWTLALAGHLLRRAAFGATWSQLQQTLADGPQRAIDRLVRPGAEADAFNRSIDKYEAGGSDAGELRGWWLRRMIETPHPLLETMTLFWHSHFAISNERVNSGPLMNQYLQHLRRHALGGFDRLLAGIPSQAAVLLSSNAQANRFARPNESLPRLLMEQFTLGDGHFSDQDVREAARAFTGWFVLREELRYFEREHDTGTKNMFGQQGPFEGKDVIRIVLQQPATAQALTAKLYRWLISETVPAPDSLTSPLAARFAKDYDIAKLVETMLRSNLFFSAAACREKIKSPVEFAVSIVRSLGGTVGTTRLGADLAGLGQDLYQPPTLKGWAGSRHWINSYTLVGRSRLAAALFASSGPYEGKLDPLAAASKHGQATVESASRFLLELFLQGEVSSEVHQAVREAVRTRGNGAGNPAEQVRQIAALIVSLPEFHLA